MDSQFFSQDFLQVISFLQTTQILLGRKLLFPLNDVFILIRDRQVGSVFA